MTSGGRHADGGHADGKESERRQTGSRETRIIGVSSGKGGVGKTTVVANLALALKRMGKEVLVIDCNFSTPHLSYYLGVNDYRFTINDVMLGTIGMRDALYNYNGIKYIPASLDLKDIVGLDTKKFHGQLLKFAQAGSVDFILLDSAPGLGREALSVLQASDEILFVTTPFVAMVHDVMRCAKVVREIGREDGTAGRSSGARKKIGVVLNMTTKGKHELAGNAVEEVAQLPVLCEVPFDKEVVYSMVIGSPVLDYNPRCASSVSFMKLASALSGEPYKPPSRLSSLFDRLVNMLPARIKMPQSREDIAEEFIESA